MPKVDLVKMAKDISSLTNVPLPKVAAVLQKYPPDGSQAKKAYDECRALAAAEMDKSLKKMFNI